MEKEEAGGVRHRRREEKEAEEKEGLGGWEKGRGRGHSIPTSQV